MKAHCFWAAALAFLALCGCRPESQTAVNSTRDGTGGGPIPQENCNLSAALTNRVIAAVDGSQVGALGLIGISESTIARDLYNVPLCDSATSARVEQALEKIRIAEACGDPTPIDASSGHGGPSNLMAQLRRNEVTGKFYVSILGRAGKTGIYREIVACNLPSV